MDINDHINANDITWAFKNNHENFLRKVHLYLNKNYYKLIFNQDEEHRLNDEEIYQLKQIENIWIEHEKSECFNKYDCYKRIKNAIDVENVLREHPAYQHSIFKYLNRQATLDEITIFIENEAILNVEFFDYLAYSVIGVSEQAKLEIMCNMWDKAGRGCIQLFHTMQFKKLMKGLGLKYNRERMIDKMSWEGIAGINLFSYMSIYTSNKMKYFGLLAATEMLDLPYYHQLLKGLSRENTSHTVDASYYVEHEILGVVHAHGWLNNVALPILRQQPNKVADFWLGFYLRLDSIQRYYDKLLKIIKSKKAA